MGRHAKKRINVYPFGLEHKGYNNMVNGVENNYFTYQGKEHDKSLDLNWHDFGARQYDAAIGRWISSDPLAEEFYEWSPYNAMMDNPIKYIDPDGMAPYDWFKGENGNIVWFDNDSESFTNDSGEWTNVGSNESEVKETLGIPSDQNIQYTTGSGLMFGGDPSQSVGSGAVALVTAGFGTGVVTNTADVSYSLNIEGKGEFGQLQDGVSEVTGVNIEMTLSSEISLPGVEMVNIVGDFSLSRSTPSGNQRTNISSPFVESGPMLGSQGRTIASSKATINMSVGELHRKSRNNVTGVPSLNFDIDAYSGYTNKGTPGSGIKGILNISN
ncbi:RHS repeat-associated core domain-containing protein [Maribacter sp. 2-571]|uniref:RHS repeat-associated core domain-containing protein n=1 Tax=Maribacter sp. 2-571 TaxID=3417569 RepID=UPI003D33723A